MKFLNCKVALQAKAKSAYSMTKRAKVVSGEVRITSSYEATKMWINHSSPEFTDFRAKLGSQSTPMRSISTTSILSQKTVLNDFITGTVVISTLADLYMQTEGGDFYVPAIITGIETSGEWYYISCKSAGCNKKLKLDDKGLLFCEKCKHKWQKGVVRYKVVVRVADAHSDAPFLMWDRECSELLGMPAAELIANYNEENGEVPTELETMIGKAMVFKINIKKENKHIYGSAFTVMRVLRDDGIVTAYCSSLAPDQERDLISKMIEECSDDDSDMEASQGDEVNSPNTACKEIQHEGDNQFSPLTKRCLLDQFSSTHNLKKGKLDSIKKEKIN
nr:replication protein A 70 kDa DNA-binding subunit-like [Ipomoea batatas]